jgi:hypothetical protein
MAAALFLWCRAVSRFAGWMWGDLLRWVGGMVGGVCLLCWLVVMCGEEMVLVDVDGR